jgi:hypothetical protein
MLGVRRTVIRGQVRHCAGVPRRLASPDRVLETHPVRSRGSARLGARAVATDHLGTRPGTGPRPVARGSGCAPPRQDRGSSARRPLRNGWSAARWPAVPRETCGALPSNGARGAEPASGDREPTRAGCEAGRHTVLPSAPRVARPGHSGSGRGHPIAGVGLDGSAPRLHGRRQPTARGWGGSGGSGDRQEGRNQATGERENGLRGIWGPGTWHLAAGGTEERGRCPRWPRDFRPHGCGVGEAGRHMNRATPGLA